VLRSVEATSDKKLVDEWKQQEENAQARRDKHPSAMDIYDLRVSDGD